MSRNTAKDTGIGIGVIAGIIAGVFILGIIIVVLSGGFSALTADLRGQTDVRERTVADGSFRIKAYEEFFDDCAAVQGLEDQIANMKANPAGLPKDQVATNILALQNQRQRLIRQYNADARKAGTVAQFRASDLPARIDPTEETTTC